MVGDGLDMHIPKGYIYFAMAFSVMVEMLNMRLRRHGRPVKRTWRKKARSRRTEAEIEKVSN